MSGVGKPPVKGMGRGRGRLPSSAPGGPIPPSSAVGGLTSALSKVSIGGSTLQPVARPPGGNAGRRVTLETNFFVMKTLMPHLVLFRYEVEIVTPPRVAGRGRGRVLTAAKPDVFDSELARQSSYEIMRRCIDANPEIFPLPTGLAYDRRRALYSIEKLKLTNQFNWTDAGQTESRVKIVQSTERPVVQFSNVLDEMKSVFGSADRALAQFLDIVTSQFNYDGWYNAQDKSAVYTPYGRQFFRPIDLPRGELGHGRLAHDGIFKSVRMVMGKPENEPVICLNVDAKKAPFYKPQYLLATVDQIIHLSSAPVTLDQIRLLTRHLKGVKVQTTYSGAIYTISFISEQNALQLKFPMEGNEITVAEYFQMRYKALQHPGLPCVVCWLQSGNVYLPMELLVVLPNQKVDLKKSTREQSEKLIKLSAVKPVERRREILEKVQFCGGGQNDPYCQQFGLQRQTEMMKVEGRILNPPGIQVDRQVLQASGGEWRPFHSRLLDASTISKWTAVAVMPQGSVSEQQVGGFIKNLVRACNRLGIAMHSNPFNINRIDPDEKAIEVYFSTCAAEGVEFVLAFVVKDDPTTRNLIKYYGDVVYDVPNQCIKKDTLAKDSLATYNNIALKVNVKTGGVNNCIADKDPLVQEWIKRSDGVMYLGFDVTHPPALSRREIAQGVVPKEPSIVGAVANTNGGISKYTMQFYLQDSRQEEINGEVMRELIGKFVEHYRANHDGKEPTKVVVYRDGVSESQYKMVLARETNSLKSAFAALCPKSDVKVTVIVVQKRHHTRFFNMNMNPNDKAAIQNIPAGTVVDTGPVSPMLFEYYLCSHAGIQGTSKATKYVVLWDENKFTSDSLQRLSYVLAHVYQRCTKSVSLPAPVYFAHHVATRGKELYNAYTRGGRDESSSGAGSTVEGAGDSTMQDFRSIQDHIQRLGNRTFKNMSFL